jgi:hypothetical protein
MEEERRKALTELRKAIPYSIHDLDVNDVSLPWAAIIKVAEVLKTRDLVLARLLTDEEGDDLWEGGSVGDIVWMPVQDVLLSIWTMQVSHVHVFETPIHVHAFEV